jgi:hypothetical protein
VADEHLMIEGYLVLAEKHKEFAEMVAKIALEVIPEWE